MNKNYVLFYIIWSNILVNGEYQNRAHIFHSWDCSIQVLFHFWFFFFLICPSARSSEKCRYEYNYNGRGYLMRQFRQIISYLMDSYVFILLRNIIYDVSKQDVVKISFILETRLPSEKSHFTNNPSEREEIGQCWAWNCFW